MAKRGTLVALGATGAVTVIAWRRRKRGRGVSPLRVGVWAALVGGSGLLRPSTDILEDFLGDFDSISSDILDVTDDVTGGIDSILGDAIGDVLGFGSQLLSGLVSLITNGVQDIENWVLDAIGLAIKGYDKIIRPGLTAAINLAARGVDVVEFVAQEAILTFQKVADEIDAVTSSILDTVRGWISDAVTEAVSLASGAASDLTNWITDAINGVESAAESLYNNVIDPIYHWVQNAESWLQARLASWWDDLYRDVIGPALADIWSAIQAVPGIVSWVADHALAAVDLVEQCAEWLGWMAAHDFESIVHLWGMSPEQLAKELFAASTSWGGSVSDELEQYLTDLLGT